MTESTASAEVMLAALGSAGPALAWVPRGGVPSWWTVAFAGQLQRCAGCDGAALPAWLGAADWARLLQSGVLQRPAVAIADRAATGAESSTAAWRLVLAGAPDDAAGRWLSIEQVSPPAAGAEPAAPWQVRLNLVQEFSRSGYFERDPRTDQGWWDPHMYRIWGMEVPPPGTPSPPYADTAARIHPADLRPGAFQRSVAMGGVHSAHIRVQWPDGSWRRLRSQWRVITDAQGQATRVVGVHTDDTEVYELARAAEQLHSEMEAALSFGQVGLWRQDLASGRVLPDRRAAEMMGLDYRQEGYSLAQARAHVHPDDLPRIEAAHAHTLRTGEPSETEVRYPLPGGGWRHTLARRSLSRAADGQLTGYLGMMVDVTQMVEQSRRAAEAANRVELAQRALGLGIWHGVVGADGAWWDEQMFSLRGVPSPARRVQRAEALSYLHPDDRHMLTDAYAELSQDGSGWRLEYRVCLPDGQVRWLASRSRVLPASGSEPARHFGVNWDVTDTHLAEQALRDSQRERAENEAKTQFLSRMSHELRTPLNAVLGFTQLMRSTPQGPAELRERWLGHVEDAGHHLLALIDDVLDLARAEVGQLRVQIRPERAGEVLASALALVASSAEQRQLKLITEVDEQVLLLCDALRLRQVLLNLLSNAVKYNRVGGRIRVAVRRDGDRVRIGVADDGPGLSSAQQAELFKPFHRLGAERSGVDGVGIGLSIARTLVEQMDGRIEVRSQPGQGCLFEVSLPVAAAAPTPTPTPTPAPAAATRLDGPVGPVVQTLAEPAARVAARVLYVEDNTVNAMLVRELLRTQADLELRIASSGQEGMALAVQWPPDVALLDLQLPDSSGYQVMAALRRLPGLAQLPCVALSAAATDEQIASAKAAGFDDYWTKPIDLQGFLPQLRALLRPPAVATPAGPGRGGTPD